MKIHSVAIAAVILSVTSIAEACFAETYPSKPIRLIVPSGAGGAPDVRARWLAEKLRAGLGQPIIVENKPGASSILGTLTVTQSRPDGYTILLSHQGIMALNPHLHANLPYDPFKDLMPVSRLVVSPMILVVHPDVPARSVADLVRLAKEKPGQLNFGSPGVGTPPHMAGELFKRSAHIDVNNVAYRSTPSLLIDLIGGRLTYAFDSLASVLPHIRGGTLRPLAVTSPKRVASLPDVPTVAETIPGFEYWSWMGICVPAGTPKAIVMRLNQELNRILGTQEARDWFAEQGGEPIVETPEEFDAYIRKEHAYWGKVIRETGMKIE